MVGCWYRCLGKKDNLLNSGYILNRRSLRMVEQKKAAIEAASEMIKV